MKLLPYDETIKEYADKKRGKIILKCVKELILLFLAFFEFVLSACKIDDFSQLLFHSK